MRQDSGQGHMQSPSSLELLMRALLLALLLTGCSTVVPVTAKFPEAPGNVAMTACPQLRKIAEDARLSDISKTITMNYSTYYECAVKTDAWIEWYQKQQQIFNNVK
jgi:hypothetical protein